MTKKGASVRTDKQCESSAETAPMLPPSQRLLQLARSGVVKKGDDGDAAMTFHGLAEILTLSHYTSEILRDGNRERMGDIKARLGFDTAPELERLLIEQIALCWLRIGEAEANYSGVMRQSHTFAQAAGAERRLSACMTRYVRACESLARVRRLSKGIAVQVNFANQQIVTG